MTEQRRNMTNEQAQAIVAAMTPEARAEQAQELQNNALFVATLADIENAELQSLLNTSFDAADIREVHYFKITLLRNLRTKIENVSVNLRAPTRNSARTDAENVLKRK